MLRRIFAFVVTLGFMVILGSASQSLFVQAAWSGAAGQVDGNGATSIPVAERIAWVAHDLGGTIVPYGGTTSIALVLAFLAAGALARIVGHRAIVFGVAGALAIFVLFTALRLFLGTVGIFGVRGPFGLGAQMLVGLCAGTLFARLTPRKMPQSATPGPAPVPRS